jgi:uncharacterized protein YbjT (DUF2867 family)
MIFVSGITGHVGGTAAQQLLDRGHAVRTLARDPGKAAAWAARGVDVRQGDFLDPAAVAAALDGVAAAYLMMPPVFAPARGFPEAKAVVASFRAALERASPPRLVVLSSIGSQQTRGLGNITSTHLLEQALIDLPSATAFVRAGSFLENYAFGLKAAAATGWFDSYLAPTDRPVPMIASADVGRQVARLLVGDWTGRKIVELGSRASPDELAAAMGEALGRPVKARAVPRETWAASLEASGMVPGSTWAFEEMEDSFNSGWIDFGVPGTEPVAATVTPRQFFAQLVAASGAPSS